MIRKLVRQVYHPLYRLAVRVRCFWTDHTETAVGLPPAILRFRVSESTSANLFINIGQGCARIIEARIGDGGVVLEKGSRVLDFGCGCGRTIKWLMRDHPDVKFYGCDVDAEAVRWCRGNLGAGSFHVNEPTPPLPYESAFFDVIYCFSVFTHLDETMQGTWLEELCRIVKPNGLFIMTVHGSNAAMNLTPSERSELQTSGFIHKTSPKLRGLVPEWYHTTWHSRVYITAKLLGFFEKVSYVEIADGIQDCVVATQRRPRP